MFTDIFSTNIQQAKSTTNVGSHIDLCQVKPLEHKQKLVLMEYKNIVGLDEFVETVEAQRDISGLKSSPIFFQLNLSVYQKILPPNTDLSPFKSWGVLVCVSYEEGSAACLPMLLQKIPLNLQWSDMDFSCHQQKHCKQPLYLAGHAKMDHRKRFHVHQ